MNREIKFRGISKCQGEHWIYGDIVHKRNGDVYINNTIYGGTDVESESVGQFTGLHDKKGKEIYEGDIIKSPLGNVVIVEFGYHEELVYRKDLGLADSFASYGWIAKNVKNGIIGFLDNTFTAGEVVGNIHDNKYSLED